MSIRISNPHLEQQVSREAERRGYKSMARCLEDLAAERLRDIHHERVNQKREPASAGA